MALRITERDVNGVNVLDIDGRIVLGEESNAFRERVKALLAAGKKKIVLNLANVTYIDSAGLGTLVATFHSAKSQGAMKPRPSQGIFTLAAWKALATNSEQMNSSSGISILGIL